MKKKGKRRHKTTELTLMLRNNQLMQARRRMKTRTNKNWSYRKLTLVQLTIFSSTVAVNLRTMLRFPPSWSLLIFSPPLKVILMSLWSNSKLTSRQDIKRRRRLSNTVNRRWKLQRDKPRRTLSLSLRHTESKRSTSIEQLISSDKNNKKESISTSQKIN